MPATSVIGREDELTSIEAFLERIQDGPGALVLSGEPGIGKTILWEKGVEKAGERSHRVLSHRSVEAEALLSFTGLSDLLAYVFEETAPSLAPLRRRALEVALLLAEPGAEAPDPRAIGLALLDVLRVLAEQGPVLVALDDLQWLDPLPRASCRSRCGDWTTSPWVCWRRSAPDPRHHPRSSSSRRFPKNGSCACRSAP